MYGRGGTYTYIMTYTCITRSESGDENYLQSSAAVAGGIISPLGDGPWECVNRTPTVVEYIIY